MLKIGSYNQLVVEREVDFGFYLNTKEEGEVLLPKKYAPDGLKPGDTITVFVYTDSEDRPVSTTLKPKAVVGECAFLGVKDTRQFGAFLDWGLEKDLFVPNSQMQDRMKKNENHVVKVCLDERTDRVYASARISEHCNKNPAYLVEGQEVGLLIYGINKTGILAVVNNEYCGMLYHGETYKTLSLGDTATGYIQKIRDDGKIDLLLKKPGYGSVSESKTKILEVLKQSAGFVPCHDKSSPDKINRLFSMSKKEFKRAIGGLYKERIIVITDKGICLKD